MGIGYDAVAIDVDDLEGDVDIYGLLKSGLDLGRMASAAQKAIAGGLETREPYLTGERWGSHLGLETAFLADSEAVRRVAAGLDGLTEPVLRARSNAQYLEEQAAYPMVWDEDPEELAEAVADAAIRLVELYREAAAQGKSILAWVSI